MRKGYISCDFDQPNTASHETKKGSGVKPLRLFSRKPILGFFLVLVSIIFLAIPYWYTSNPKSCVRCHQMKPFYESWKASMHSTAAKNCFYCHVKPGTMNLLVYRVAFYREIFASFSGQKLSPIGATLPATDSCRRRGCHSLNRVSSISGDIKIDHKTHVLVAKVSCVRCHPGTAHPYVNNERFPRPPRKICFDCHGARTKDCSYCHIKRFSREISPHP